MFQIWVILIATEMISECMHLFGEYGLNCTDVATEAAAEPTEHHVRDVLHGGEDDGLVRVEIA